jgi:hypothetical protein
VALAPFGAGLGEVQVLDDYCLGAVPRGRGDDFADRGAHARVPGSGGQPGQVQADGRGGAEDVPVGRDDRDREMAGVDVDRHHRARPQLV